MPNVSRGTPSRVSSRRAAKRQLFAGGRKSFPGGRTNEKTGRALPSRRPVQIHIAQFVTRAGDRTRTGDVQLGKEAENQGLTSPTANSPLSTSCSLRCTLTLWRPEHHAAARCGPRCHASGVGRQGSCCPRDHHSAAAASSSLNSRVDIEGGVRVAGVRPKISVKSLSGFVVVCAIRESWLCTRERPTTSRRIAGRRRPTAEWPDPPRPSTRRHVPRICASMRSEHSRKWVPHRGSGSAPHWS